MYDSLFCQLFDPESSTYSDLMADNHSKQAILVDPILEQIEDIILVV